MKKTLLFILLGFLGMSLYAQTQFETKYKDLPKDTQKYVSKNYDGWTIDKCVMGESAKQKMTFCEVYATKGTEKVKLIFDKDGQFVKKEIVAEQTKAPAAAPATAPAAVPAAVPAVAPAAAPAVAAPAAAPDTA